MTITNTIFRAAAEVYNCSLSDVYGKSQKRHIADARRTAYLLIRNKTKQPYRKIATHLNRTTHTGILDMVQKATGYMKTDKTFNELYQQTADLFHLIWQKESRKKQRYDAHYRIRKKGFRVSSYDRTIWMPSSKLNGHEPAEFKLLRKHGYSIQLTIDQL